jgi:hypothetical protein
MKTLSVGDLHYTHEQLEGITCPASKCRTALS